MKILIIGGSGTIGKAIVKELSPRHEIILASRNGSDIQVDITNLKSIQEMYKQVANLDAIILAFGTVHFGKLEEMTHELYQIGLQNKLMGQVNVVLEGMKYLNDKGSFTLTSGILNHEPIVFGSNASMVNGALEGFVRHAAIELPRGLRINLISPTVITEAMDSYAPYFRGFKPVSAYDAALAYSKSVEGANTGQIYIVK